MAQITTTKKYVEFASQSAWNNGGQYAKSYSNDSKHEIGFVGLKVPADNDTQNLSTQCKVTAVNLSVTYATDTSAFANLRAGKLYAKAALFSNASTKVADLTGYSELGTKYCDASASTYTPTFTFGGLNVGSMYGVGIVFQVANYKYESYSREHRVRNITLSYTRTRACLITFKNYDGSTLSSKVYDYDATVSQASPERPNYSFAGWKSSLDNKVYTTIPKAGEVDVTYTAQFNAIPVTNITLNKTSTSIEKGKTETLTATITPSNATNKNVTWSSNNTNVATVNNGVVTAVEAGSCVITATSQGNTSKTATCSVTVTSPSEGIRKIKIGSNTIETIKLGTNNINKVYLGNNLLFSK